MDNQVIKENSTCNLLTDDLININSPELLKKGFNPLEFIKKYKLYIFGVVGIILFAGLLYFLYVKKKGKKTNNNTNVTMLNVVNPDNNLKLLYNPVDKQYYELDSNGNTVKTTLELYQKQNKHNKKYNQESFDESNHEQMLKYNRDQQAKDQQARDQQARDQQARDQLARDQLARDQQARDQQARDQQARDQQARDQQARDQQARDQQSKKKSKLTHVSESESEVTSENIQYNMNDIDDNINISQFNLNSEDMNEINSKLSDNN